MPCSTNFSMTLETGFVVVVVLTQISDFLKQIIFLKSFSSVFFMFFFFFFGLTFRTENGMGVGQVCHIICLGA